MVSLMRRKTSYLFQNNNFFIGTNSLLNTFQSIRTTKYNHRSIGAKNGSTKLSSTQSISIDGKTMNKYELVVFLE
jgi:hypothetical protein